MAKANSVLASAKDKVAFRHRQPGIKDYATLPRVQ